MKSLISFILDTRNNRPGEARVRMRVKWGENMVQRFIPYTVNPEKWNKGARRCTTNTTHGKHKVSASVINSELQLYEDSAEKALKGSPSKEEFIDKFNGLIGKGEKVKELSVFDIFKDYIKTQGLRKGWTKRNYQKNNTVLGHLRNFNPKIKFSDLENEGTFDLFIRYLNSPNARLNKKGLEKGLQNSTVERYISMLKWFLGWAEEKGYYKGKQYKYKIELKGTDAKLRLPVFFTWDELLHFYSYDFNSNKYEQVRDCISFCCFTSLRHSDLITLRRSDVKKDHIVVFTEKTDETIFINLNDYSRAILDKYKDESFVDDLALPVISNQKMNDYIKEMGKIMGYDTPTRIAYYVGSNRVEEVLPRYELFSTHMGRRTFIVNALYLGIPAEVVMRWTGHKDYESMKPYISIVDGLKSKEMDKFNAKSPTL